MILPGEIIDLSKLFKDQFGTKPYVINKQGELMNTEPSPYVLFNDLQAGELAFTAKGSLIKETVKGIEVLLPVRFYNGPQLLMELLYCVVSIKGKKQVVKTSLVERKGTVKELYSSDDYGMTVKGFLIDDNRKFPEDQLEQMKQLCERETAVTVDNALFNIFLTDNTIAQDEQRRVVILDYEFPEVQGGRHARPFVLQLESDFVFTLELTA